MEATPVASTTAVLSHTTRNLLGIAHSLNRIVRRISPAPLTDRPKKPCARRPSQNRQICTLQWSSPPFPRACRLKTSSTRKAPSTRSENSTIQWIFLTASLIKCRTLWTSQATHPPPDSQSHRIWLKASSAKPNSTSHEKCLLRL